MKEHIGVRRKSFSVVVVAVSLVLSASCGAGTRAPNEVRSADDPGLSHVHALGVDPASGALYAATHYGLFSVPLKGTATRIADRYQDTMGFVISRPDLWLGSGQPDIQDQRLHSPGKPPLLGLVESRDRGSTWTALSLLGEADFHAIATSGETIAAYDSTGDRLMISRDGITWETKASGEAITALALRPEDPQQVLGVRTDGLALSMDGGQSFQAMASAPKGAFVSWVARDEIWTVDVEGRVWRATGPESPWSPQGRLPGAPEAFLATSGTLFAAATLDDRSGIYSSKDEGRSWQLRYRDPTR